MAEYTTLFTEKYITDKLKLNEFVIPNLENKLSVISRWIKENKDKSEDDINYNPLFSGIKRDSIFFDNMFGSFEKYTEFFCLNKSCDKKQNWVKDGQVLNLLNNQPLDDYDFGNKNNVLLTADNWWIFYSNIMNRLDARNEQIKEVIEGK